MPRFDLAVINGTLVIPFVGMVRADLAARDGKVALMADSIAPSVAETVVDARDRLVFPGGVDAHFHVGIYRPVSEDAESETRSALVGGVSTVLSYFRTGSHYLNRSGPYREILPEVLAATEGRAYVDYGYHIAIMTSAQLDEIDWLVGEAGVASFKYYMFYKGLNLAASSADAAAYTMSGNYDFGHLYSRMERVAAADARYGEEGRISLSIHCENAELIKLFIERVRDLGRPPLETYHEARPPLTERLSIHE